VHGSDRGARTLQLEENFDQRQDGSEKVQEAADEEAGVDTSAARAKGIDDDYRNSEDHPTRVRDTKFVTAQ